MAKRKVKFNEDHIALIKSMLFEKLENNYALVSQSDNLEVLKSFGKSYTIGVFDEENEEQTEPYKGKVKIEARTNYGDNHFGVDTYQLYGGTYLYEQMAYILGKTDHVIPETLSDPQGPIYDEETMALFCELDSFIREHLTDIFEILLQFCDEGIKPGIEYWCLDNEHIWKKNE